MSTLLSFRFDHIVFEQLSKGLNVASPFTLLSICLYVSNIKKERKNFSHLLGTTPCFENKNTVVLQISDEIMFFLRNVEEKDLYSRQDDTFMPEVGQVELDLETKDLQLTWQNAQTLTSWYSSKIVSTRYSSLFKVINPTGLILCFWQKALNTK